MAGQWKLKWVKLIEEFENYEVSSLGRVKNSISTERILKPIIKSGGYVHCWIIKYKL